MNIFNGSVFPDGLVIIDYKKIVAYFV